MNTFERQNPEDNAEIPIRKKRKVHNRTLQKQARTSGEAFVDNKGKKRPKRVSGPSCRCSRLKCYQKISEEQRNQEILSKFNEMPSKNAQDSHLSGLISFHPPKQRRSRKKQQDLPTETQDERDEEISDEPLLKKYQHAASFMYKVRCDGIEIPVCEKAFCSLHGITKGRLRRLRVSLFKTGKSPIDRRGKHANRPRKTEQRTYFAVRNHIKSFKCRQSHYSRRDNPNVYYLPETLSIKKMYKNFCEENPNIKVSYKVYWQVFTKDFKLKFGVPKSDTCSFCDQIIHKLAIEQDDEIKARLQTEQKLHLCKADQFYQLKKFYRTKARENPEKYSCISFDYMQNLPVPHIRTNEVFYAVQMWYFVFGVHNEGNDSVLMYCYDETLAKKGQNDVASLLFHFLKCSDLTTKNLILISDGCAGQNKNYVLMRFLYVLVHLLGLFETIVHVFPIRGHSFLSNDRDFSLIEKQKKTVTVEVPSEWDSIIKEARIKPTPYEVINVQQKMIFDIESVVSPYFLKQPKPPVKIKAARMLKYDIKEPGFVLTRQSYSGEWEKSYIRNNKVLPKEINFKQKYSGQVPLKKSKIKSLVSLSKFIKKPENIEYYSTFLNKIQDIKTESNEQDDLEVDDEDNSSGSDMD